MKLIDQNSKARENMIRDEYWLIGFTQGDSTFSSNKLKPNIKYENPKELELFKSNLNNLKSGLLYIRYKVSRFCTIRSKEYKYFNEQNNTYFYRGMYTKYI
jgi:hypothetical protein